MIVKKISFILLSFLIADAYSTLGFALDLPGKYIVMGKQSDIVKTDTVEILEFFNFSCGHCYRYTETYKKLEKRFGKRLKRIEIPIFWGKQTPLPAMAFYIASEKDMGPMVKKEIFDANFKMNIDVFDRRNIGFIASSVGIGEDFEKGIKAPRILKLVKKNQNLANSYEVSETPTIVLNRSIKVIPRLTDGDVDKMTDNLALIISGLLK